MKEVLVCVGLSLFTPLSLLYSQATTATILGTVTDPSGAVVPGAKVTAINELTGFSRTATTINDGSYLIQFLPIGNKYRVEAELAGFKTQISTGISLQVGQNAKVDIKLEMGQEAQKVEVTAAVPLVDTYSATRGDVIESRRLKELPLNGRSPLQLAATVAGATVVSVPIDVVSGRGGATISVNGSYTNSMDHSLDGIRFAGAYSNSGLEYPSPDALAEFKLITNPLSAEYGQWAGSTFTAVVKSGTNEFHGDVFEFLRNDKLQARNFFAPRRFPYRQNQFGVDAGGPIIKNRVFWFGSFQGLRIRSYALTSSVPFTTDERNGLITSSTPVKDPLTGQPFPTNSSGQYVIPSNRFDPVAVDVLKKYVPVGTGGPLFTDSSNKNDANQYVGKIDYAISNKDQVRGMYFRQTTTPVGAFNHGPYAGYGSYTSSGVQANLSISETHTFSPTLINEARFGFAGQAEIRLEEDNISPASLGPNGIKGWDYTGTAESGNIFGSTKRPMVSATIGVTGRFSIGDSGLNNWREGGRNWQFGDAVTLVKGRHNIKMGLDFYRRQHYLDVNVCGTGCFTSNGTVTGSPAADFMLGALSNALRIQYATNPGYLSWSRNFFVQDDFKVTRNLTLNLGLRYELHQPFREYRAQGSEYGLDVAGFGTWSLAAYNAGTKSKAFPYAPPGMVYPGDVTPDYPNGIPSTLIPTDKWQIQPRIGMAWDPFGTGLTSVRASIGLFTDAGAAWTTSFAGNNLPFIAINQNPNPPGVLSDPYRGLVPYPTTSFKSIQSDPAFFQLPSDASEFPKNFVKPRITTLTFSISRQLVPNLVLEVGYVGKLGRHMELWHSVNPAVYIPGTDPATGQPYSTLANVNSRRIRALDFGHIAAIGRYESEGNSSFNSLQSTLRYTFSHGLSLLNSYTYSHSIDIVSCTLACLAGQDPYNLNGSRGSSDYDRRHVDALSLVYDIPSAYRGQNSALKQVVNGWEVSSLVRLVTGAPFSVLDGFDASLTGANSPLGGTQGRPDLIGNPYLSGDRSKEQKILKWFDPAAFRVNLPGTYGNSGRNLQNGPGFWNTDIGVFKNFQISEDMRLQFRTELFNAFNHANLLNPVANMLSGINGRITSTSEARIIQFGLKFAW